MAGLMDGDSLAKMLMNVQASCTTCGTKITFESGANLAKKYGVTDNVVMCPQCKSVFTVQLVPGRMTLTENVTEKYKETIEKAAASSKAGGGFFKNLFKK